MEVINYYELPENELDSKIEQIRSWMFEHPKDPRQSKAAFALDVALCAKKLRSSKKLNSMVRSVCC